MRDQSSTLKAEYNFWMLALSSIGGALSIISLVQRIFRIGLAPILQSIVDYYRGLLRPIADTVRWGIEWIAGVLMAIVPSWLYTVPWRAVVWLWEGIAYYVLFGWLSHWLTPDFYEWVSNFPHSIPPDTYRDLYLLSFLLLLPFFRAQARTDPHMSGDLVGTFSWMALTVPVAAVGSYWLIGLLMPPWTAFVAAIGESTEAIEYDESVYYLMSLGAMSAAAVAFFAINGIMS